MNETADLARFAAEFPTASIPEEVLHLSARCLLDHLGVALGAWDEPTVRIAAAVAEDLGGKQQASLVGGGRTSLVQAATVNGIAAHVLDFDDTHDPTILHATSPVMAAALAAAEWVGASGTDLLAAHAIGFDVAARVALAVHPDHYDRGFHVTGTAGTFGAAAAAGRLLGLNAGQMANALSTAAAQAAGLREMFGSMSKSLHAGKAAGNGAYSALLARHGWVSATHGIEGRVGYWAVLSERTDPARAVAGLGSAWELYNNGQKPYACGVVSHPTIDAVRQLRIAADLAPDRVAEIRAEVNPYVLELMGKEEPAVGLEGKFSIFHCAAIGYIDRAARARQFTDQAVARPEVAALRRKVVVAVNRDLPTSAARVRLRSADGQVWEQSVEAASGTPRNPLSDEEIQEKFLDLVQERLGQSTALQVAERALNARRLSRVDDLMIVTAAAGGH